jgi:hypothetical protein
MKAEPLIVKPITQEEFDSDEAIDTSKRRGVIGGTIKKFVGTNYSKKKKGAIGGVGGDVDEDNTSRWYER